VSHAHEGGLGMAIGRDDGLVHVRCELHESAPPLDLGWEEVAEASVSFNGVDLELVSRAEAVPVTIPRAGDDRSRFSASLMDEGRSFGEKSFALVVGPDDYLLQMWPSPPEPDVTIAETSLTAKGMHALVRRLFPPPARPVTRVA
jgi:hypothetical protein